MLVCDVHQKQSWGQKVTCHRPGSVCVCQGGRGWLSREPEATGQCPLLCLRSLGAGVSGGSEEGPGDCDFVAKEWPEPSQGTRQTYKVAQLGCSPGHQVLTCNLADTSPQSLIQ